MKFIRFTLVATFLSMTGLLPLGTFAADAPAVFNLKKALNQRNVIGAPGTREVQRQLARWKRLLKLGR